MHALLEKDLSNFTPLGSNFDARIHIYILNVGNCSNEFHEILYVQGFGGNKSNYLGRIFSKFTKEKVPHPSRSSRYYVFTASTF